MSSEGFPLPPELFVLAANHLPTDDLITASHVSSKWRRTLLGNPKLWSNLDGVDLTKPRVLDRAKACLQRTDGQLSSLELGLPDDAERLVQFFVSGRTPRTVLDRLRRVLALVVRTGNATSLRHLNVSLEAAKGCDVEWYTALDDIARFCEFGAARLASLRLTSNIPNFGGVQPWLELLPHLKTLTLSCDTKDDVGVESEQSGFQARAPPGMRAPEHKPVDVAYGVEELTLSGPCVSDREFASMPNLRILRLMDSEVMNLHALLSACASSLEELWLADVDLPVTGHATGPPEVLVLPRLREAHVAGDSPVPFVPTQDRTTHFRIEAPALELVSFGSQQTLGLGERVHEGSWYLTDRVLRAIFATSPGLRSLNVDDELDQPLEAGDFVDTLGAAGPELSRLILGDSFDGRVLEKMPRVLPQLEFIHVADSSIMLLDLAKMAKEFVDTVGSSLGHPGGRELRVKITRPSDHRNQRNPDKLARPLVRALRQVQADAPGDAASKRCKLEEAMDELEPGYDSFRRIFGEGFFAPLREEVVGLMEGEAESKGGEGEEGAGGAEEVEAAEDEGEGDGGGEGWEQAVGMLRRWVDARLEQKCEDWFEATEGVNLEWENEEDRNMK